MERHKYIFGMLAAALLMLAGCSDDDTTQDGFRILESELNFEATASEGYVIVSDASCTATVSADWCRAEKADDRIRVYVDDNGNMEGRTALLTLTAAGGIQQVPVSQRGSMFRTEGDGTLFAGNAACTLSVPMSATFPFEVETADDGWLTYEITEGGLELHLTENTTGRPRITTVNLTCPVMNRQLRLVIPQYEMKDLMGKWTATYNMIDRNNVVSTTAPVTLSAGEDGGVELTGLYEGVTLRARAEDRTIAFPTGITLGTFRQQYELWQWGANADFQMIDGNNEPERLYAADLSLDDLMESGNQKLTFQTDAAFTSGTAMEGLGIKAVPLDGAGADRNVIVFTHLELTR